jgi:pilus assembly protein TadC
MTTLYLIAALAVVAVALLGWEISGRWAYLTSRGLRRLRQSDILEEDESTTLPGSSLARRLREAGLPLTPPQFYLLSIGLAATGALLCWVAFVPGLPALASGAVMAYLPFAYIDERARSRGRLIDERLAIALSRLAPGLHTGRGLDQVLEEVAQSLQAEGPNPLAPELLKTARDLRTRDASDALRDLAKRSSSLSLANVAMLLESYLRAGGGQYAEVISETAVSIQRILAVRAHAQAKAT